MVGPGKYDEVCEEIRERLKAQGVLLIVVDGINGNGAPCKMTAEIKAIMPGFLRMVADEMQSEGN